MPRYVDADALIKKIFPYDVVDKKCYSINAKIIYEEIQKSPTADVVPKSDYIQQKAEIERLGNLLDCYEETSGNKKAKAEAIKEFAEIIVSDYPEMEYYLTNLAKEMTEGES